MGVREFWKNYKVLVVMIPMLGLIHVGWYNLKGSLHQYRAQGDPEPAFEPSVSPRTSN